MREYQVPFIKQLTRGLQDYAISTLVDPQLLICYNLMPTEQGLQGHETIYGIGLRTGVAYFNYIQVKDQLGVSWYWYPVFDGHILTGSTVPSEPSTGYDAVAIITPTIPYWIEIPDASNTTWYLYPDSTSGLTRARDTVPAVGTGYKNLVWRGTTGEIWRIQYDAVLNTRHAVKV